MGANVRFRILSDYERENANLKVWCRACDHIGIVHARRLHRWCRCYGRNPEIEVVALYLRCTVCYGRPGGIAPVPSTLPITFPSWFAFEFQFGDLVKRLRNR